MNVTIKNTTFLAMIIITIAFGGYYGGKMIGIVLVALLFITYVIASDARKIRMQKKASWNMAIRKATKDFWKIWNK